MFISQEISTQQHTKGTEAAIRTTEILSLFDSEDMCTVALSKLWNHVRLSRPKKKEREKSKIVYRMVLLWTLGDVVGRVPTWARRTHGLGGRGIGVVCRVLGDFYNCTLNTLCWLNLWLNMLLCSILFPGYHVSVSFFLGPVTAILWDVLSPSR